MKFGGEIAWRDMPYLERLVIVDKLRKGIGKKDSALIGELKSKFIDGCERNGEETDLATDLFSMIESAGRYAFNDAHAKKYALYSFQTAYLKAHHPYEFYTVYMTYSKAKPKPRLELQGLINEAKMLNVNVLPPDITRQNDEFRICWHNNKRAIAFGLGHIKNVGRSDVKLIEGEVIDTWAKLFKAHFDTTRKTRLRRPSMESLITSGACDAFGVGRKRLMNMFNCCRELSAKEIKYVMGELKDDLTPQQFKTLIIKCADEVSMKKRKGLVRSEAQVMLDEEQDSFTWRAKCEEGLLGIALTCSPVDDKQIRAAKTCKECYHTSNNNRNMRASVAVVINEIIPMVTKKGKAPGSPMAQLIVSDSTGEVKVAVFPDTYKNTKEHLHKGLTYTMDLNGTGTGWCVHRLSII
jgi:DNA polymerase-3 subunit alpha